MSLLASVHARSAARFAQTVRARQHVLASDEPPSRGGTDQGATPLELLLGGLAACTSITLRMYADRKGWDLGVVTVHCRVVEDGGAERIERDIALSGPLDDAQRARLLEIAEKTPVTRIVKAGLPIATQVKPAG